MGAVISISSENRIFLVKKAEKALCPPCFLFPLPRLVLFLLFLYNKLKNEKIAETTERSLSFA